MCLLLLKVQATARAAGAQKALPTRLRPAHHTTRPAVLRQADRATTKRVAENPQNCSATVSCAVGFEPGRFNKWNPTAMGFRKCWCWFPYTSGNGAVSKKSGLFDRKFAEIKHRRITPDFEIGLAALGLWRQQEICNDLRSRSCLLIDGNGHELRIADGAGLVLPRYGAVRQFS